MTRITEAVSFIRQSADDPRIIEGLVVPYGQVAASTPIGPEAFAPGAFRDSAERWMSRTDGARLPFRPAHKEKPVGSVLELRDTDEGLRFKARIRNGARGDEYLSEIEDGQNGVSVEFDAPLGGRPVKGVTIHRQAAIYGIAGSSAPAYDGARIATRDMEAFMADTETPAPTPEPTPPAPEPAPQDRSANTIELTPQLRSVLERVDAGQYRAPAVITRESTPYARDATWSGYDERGERYSLLTDGWKMLRGDSAAGERIDRWERQVNDFQKRLERDAVNLNERAGDVLSTEIVGAYPNDYIPGLFTPRILKGRPMGGFFTRFVINDALPKIFPKTGTSTTVAVQSAEGANPAASDFTTTAITTTPALYGAETVVSRQVLDGSSPAAEAMLIQDMTEAYAQASETVIKTAVESGASASGAAIVPATPFAGVVANIVAYSVARFRNAQGVFCPSVLWAVLAKQPDTSSLRPLLSPLGPTNAVGTTNPGTLGAQMYEAAIFHSYASTTNVVVTAVPDDYVIFESAVSRFSYDAVTGPSGVRIGLWAYLAAGPRKGGLSVTAA